MHIKTTSEITQETTHEYASKLESSFLLKPKINTLNMNMSKIDKQYDTIIDIYTGWLS